jgi:2-aminoethylphosphonate-pyruvate transaminase
MLAARQQVLFNPGPVNLDAEIRSNLFNVELCHRQPEFDQLRERVERRLFEAAEFDRGEHNLSLLHGSGTLAVDAALASLVRGRVLVVDNGVYCRRIATTLESLGAGPVTAHAPGVGRRPDLEALEAEVGAERPDWIAVVHHETTTGLLNPLEEIAEIAAAHGCRLFVDAVSSLPVHRLDRRVDVACFNSNKCLESLPGIGGVFWRRDLSSEKTVPVLDLAAYVDQVPHTPHVQAYVALDIALDLLAAEDRAERYRRLARRVWEAGGSRFEPLLDEADRSHVLTSFRLGGRDPDELIRAALRHGYVIYEGQGPLREEIFRVANMGAMIDEPLIDDLFEVLSNVS